MYQKIASIAQWFSIPSICALCQHRHSEKNSICTHCSALLSRLKNPCEICSRPLPNERFLRCGECLQQKPEFDRVITNHTYDEPLRTLLHHLKYFNALYLRAFLAQLMLDAYHEQGVLKPDCLIPIPLHPARIRQRGFNQAAELTKIIARQLALPINLSHCQKIKNTPSQVGLNGTARRKNLKNSFKIDQLHYQHVLLIDDLLTTGSTANEIARELKAQGVQRVDVLCCARATN